MSAIFFFLLFNHFLLFPLHFSSAYILPDKYFINCGSESDVIFGYHDRRFIGDVNPSPEIMISPGESEVVEDNSIANSIPKIYHTARVYKRQTWYLFNNITQRGTYVVRLHFFPLSSKTYPHLSKARFYIWVTSKYRLLSNFSLDLDLENNVEKVPVVKEFAFEIKRGPFGIHFNPSRESSLAFVNAIEVFLAPERFKPDDAYPVSPEVRLNDTGSILDTSGRNTNSNPFQILKNRDSISYALGSVAFQAIYRLNNGGPLITPENDTLLRTWLPDDGFLAIPAAGKSVNYKGQGEVKYGNVTTEYTAPSSVYNTEKQLIMDREGRSKFSNLTWVFKVRKKAKYFIHLHWCDFKSDGNVRFDFFIDDNRTTFGTPVEGFIPFRLLMVIATDDSGFLKIGIARHETSKFSRAFLNGIEIMELIEKSNSMEFIGRSNPGPLPEMQKDKHELLYLLIGSLVGGLVAIALMIGLLLFYLRVRKSKKSHRNRYQEFLSHDKEIEKVSISDLAPNLNLHLKIPFSDLQIATNNFDDEKMIGVGGFGKVYHGTLGDKEVAVKRSRSGFGQGLYEFQTEIIILSRIRHRHLVSLFGYCDENEEMILVYEFMEKGTLREYLYGSNSKNHSRPSLSWKQRLQICIDAARGLDYLHTCSAGGAGGLIIHRDIKTTNILLDKDYRAKVADFGISKLGICNPNDFETTIRGTYGYLDPEYFNTGRLTEKSDVYSFGVVLLELLSARSPIVLCHPEEGEEEEGNEVNLVEWAVHCRKRGEIEKLIDPFLIETIESSSLRKFMEIAEKCWHESTTNRPSMHDVVYELELALHFQQQQQPSSSMEDSAIIDSDSTTIHAREMVSELKIDYGR